MVEVAIRAARLVEDVELEGAELEPGIRILRLEVARLLVVVLLAGERAEQPERLHRERGERVGGLGIVDRTHTIRERIERSVVPLVREPGRRERVDRSERAEAGGDPGK